MKKIKTVVKLFNDLDKKANKVLIWGIGVSILLMAFSAVGMVLNIKYYFSPDLRYITKVIAENALSIFTLSIGAGLLIDYGIKKRSNTN